MTIETADPDPASTHDPAAQRAAGATAPGALVAPMNPVDDASGVITAEAPAVGAGCPPGFEPLHPNARWGFRANQLIVALAGWIPLMILARRPLSGLLGSHGWVLVGLVTLGLALLWAWRLGDRRHRAVCFRLDEGGLSIHFGLYWQSQSHVPRSRVQHTDIQRGPLDRRLGLADLLVHTAGTQMATVRLAGLADERAQALRDALLEGHDQQF